MTLDDAINETKWALDEALNLYADVRGTDAEAMALAHYNDRLADYVLALAEARLA